MREWARATVAAGSAAYLYQFTHADPNPSLPPMGAYHHSDVQYVFGNHWRDSWTYTDVDRRVAETMSTYWVNFATTGDPRARGLVNWVPYNIADEPYMSLGDVPVMKNHLLKPQLDFLDKVQLQTTSTRR
jgi:para-nitrobenzyl esterase